MRKKTLWIVTMAILCLVLYTVVASRMAESTNVILGGAEGTFVQSDSVSFQDMTVTPAPVPTVDIWPKLTDADFENKVYLQIVNNDHLLTASSDSEIEVEKIKGTSYMMFLSEYIDYVNDFVEAIRNAKDENGEPYGFTPYIAAAYRNYSFQKHLFDSKASQIAYEMTGGKTVDYTDPIYQEAAEEAKKIVMVPGSSEHQLGLSIDIYDRNRQKAVYSDMDQEMYKWIDAHCAEYGFIKRYPTKKLLLTGWDESWHYRYVGKEVAKFVMEQDICYEEFYAHYHPDFVY